MIARSVPRSNSLLFMIWDCGLCGWRFANQDDMTAALPVYLKADSAKGFDALST